MLTAEIRQEFGLRTKPKLATLMAIVKLADAAQDGHFTGGDVARESGRSREVVYDLLSRLRKQRWLDRHPPRKGAASGRPSRTYTFTEAGRLKAAAVLAEL